MPPVLPQAAVVVETEPDSKQEKMLKDRYGAFGVEGEDFKNRHSWLLDFNYDSVQMAGQLPCYDTKKDSGEDVLSKPANYK